MPEWAWILLGVQGFIGLIAAILIWVSMIRDMRIGDIGMASRVSTVVRIRGTEPPR
ncbi:MAG: hypothetical protein HY475_01565 [Candidatus Terrybacteria bacterium]|nr:hypothetical protein [Candidatus Terrybacteria bacterium]